MTTKKSAARARRAADDARDFPANTCAASRHTQAIAEALLRRSTPLDAAIDDREHCATSLLATVTALWALRAQQIEASTTETITWRADLPDADMTVLVSLDDADSEPTWVGFFDGERWIDATTGAPFAGNVTAWADMPKGARA
jgi:hypothetical protein